MSALVGAGLLCARRRVSWPLVVAALVLPGLAVLAGRRAAASLGQAIESGRPVALSTALGLGGTAIVAGMVVALAAPRRRFLGSQLAAAPLSPVALFAAVTLAPLLLAGAAASAIEAAFLVPAVGGAAPVALAAGWAGFALGAATAEGLLGRPALRAAVLAAVAGLWTLGAAGTGTGALAGPFGYLGLALRGEPARVGPPGPVLTLLAVIALGLWALAAAARPEDAAARRDPRPVLPVGRRPLPAVLAVALKRYARRTELRRAGRTAAAAAGAGGLLLAVHAGAGVVPLVGMLAVLGAAVVPLAAVGVDREAEWLWRAAPVPRQATAAVACVAALATALLLVAVGVGPAAAWSRAPAQALLQVVGIAAFVLAAASVAGALVPWRSDRPAEELGSFAALIAVAAVLWYGLGHAVEALGGGTGISAAVLAAALCGAVALTAGVAGRGEPC
jgi:hypothetical protein